MKRYGNLYNNIISLENLRAADVIARKGKGNQSGIREFDKDRQGNLVQLYNELAAGTYRTSPYEHKIIYEPKEREISILPYRDRVVHHAIMLHTEQIWNATFTAFTYSSIKGRGIHGAANAVKEALKDVAGTTYCLKLDIQKFYPSIDHAILKNIIKKKLKDVRLLNLLDGIIDSAPGLPIGNYLSATFSNLMLSPFDHWLKEDKSVGYCFRYADDIVILSGSKSYLHALLADIRAYLQTELKLTIKSNYQVFPVAARGIDFVGYVFYHTHVLLRKRIKQNYARMMYGNPRQASMASYNSWAKHCNSRHLQKKLLHATIQRFGDNHKHIKQKLQRRQDKNRAAA
ncbi:reverse transcriptase/maturase family protein [Mucilaginibacter sp.]|uniref:reverse transcriptase/maturase family protein n=1 Tax=Mucilaginibacter sp. TaxID=1882438 RepID=UPI003263CC06